ncbi:hypothetical protein K466DRAFT_103352 [Polyporus arcularius HHB13444]|uniref:Uncharacterized protein n=1 Tax=Polyporus arcularius HHB13444 TaxID=1314778 RepID=A0A5C3PNU9_9APHY|nr:hypothetical protein K466DRAFT_103352 [Polyporus arcularius HHB13444]
MGAAHQSGIKCTARKAAGSAGEMSSVGADAFALFLASPIRARAVPPAFSPSSQTALILILRSVRPTILTEPTRRLSLALGTCRPAQCSPASTDTHIPSRDLGAELAAAAGTPARRLCL